MNSKNVVLRLRKHYCTRDKPLRPPVVVARVFVTALQSGNIASSRSAYAFVLARKHEIFLPRVEHVKLPERRFQGFRPPPNRRLLFPIARAVFGWCGNIMNAGTREAELVFIRDADHAESAVSFPDTVNDHDKRVFVYAQPGVRFLAHPFPLLLGEVLFEYGLRFGKRRKNVVRHPFCIGALQRCVNDSRKKHPGSANGIGRKEESTKARPPHFRAVG